MAASREVALSQLIGALSSALDIGEGEPAGHAARSCLIGMRLANVIGLDASARSDLFYALLLKDAGCSANAAHIAALFGADDQEAKRTSKLVDWARPVSAFVWSLKTVAPDGSLSEKSERLRAIRAEGQVTRSLMRARCYRGADIARKLGFSEATADAIRALDEHWDGLGQPHGLSGEAIPLAARIMCLAQTVEVFHAARDPDIACRVAAKRSGQWFDPALVEALGSFRDDDLFWQSLRSPDVTAVEPPDRVLTADEDRLNLIAAGFAAVIDAKSPWTHEHCAHVCTIAVGMGEQLGFDEPALRELQRAALLHDIGKLSILGRVPSFGELAAVASAHHERLDGSGYPRGLAGDQLTRSMRVLAVADVYEALISDRPYRTAYSPRVALELMSSDVPSGLDPDAFGALKSLLAKPNIWTAEGRPIGAPPQAR